MRVLVISVLLLILGVNPTYGEEKSCDEMILATSSDVKKHFEALKVYKKVEDETEEYKAAVADYSNDLTTYGNDVAALETAIRLNMMGIGVKHGVDGIREMRIVLGVTKLAVKDIEDKSSEVVLLCSGRMMPKRRPSNPLPFRCLPPGSVS